MTGFHRVIAQNSLSAKQNAKRLHGAPLGFGEMYSPGARPVPRVTMQTSTKTTKTTTALKNRAVVKKQGSRKNPSRSQKKRNNILLPAFLGSVSNPWKFSPGHVPDQSTAASGCVTSTLYLNQSFSDSTATATTHHFGFMLPPFPYFSYFASTGGVANLSDLTANGTQWLGLSGTPTSSPPAVPNLASITGQSLDFVQRSRMRSTGISVSVVYEGTELQRSGKYFAGLIPMSGVGTIVGTTGTQISLLGAAGGTTTTDSSPAFGNIRNQCVKSTEQRIGDGPFICRWLPSGSPSYQLAASGTPEAFTTTAGVPPTASCWNVAKGGPGVEGGQNALIFCVIGDQTSAASATSNPYTINIRWTWEVIPDNPQSVPYPLTPSPCDGKSLDACLNAFQGLTVGIMQGNGTPSA